MYIYLCRCTYMYVDVHTCMYMYIHVCTKRPVKRYTYIHVCTKKPVKRSTYIRLSQYVPPLDSHVCRSFHRSLCANMYAQRDLWKDLHTSFSLSTLHLSIHMYVQPIAFGVSLDLNPQSQSLWSLFDGTWQKRPRELDHRLWIENEEMTLQMQQAVHIFTGHFVHT